MNILYFYSFFIFFFYLILINRKRYNNHTKQEYKELCDRHCLSEDKNRNKKQLIKPPTPFIITTMSLMMTLVFKLFCSPIILNGSLDIKLVLLLFFSLNWYFKCLIETKRMKFGFKTKEMIKDEKRKKLSKYRLFAFGM